MNGVMPCLVPSAAKYSGTQPDITHSQKKKRNDGKSAAATTKTGPFMSDAVAEANLAVAIVDAKIPTILVTLTNKKYNKLYESVNGLIFDAIVGDKPAPIFNKLTKGVMRVLCSTPAAKAWLFGAIQCIPPLWEGMSLQVVDFDKLPQQKRVLGLFPYCNMDAKQILQVLQVMNTCLNPNYWSPMNSKKNGTGHPHRFQY